MGYTPWVRHTPERAMNKKLRAAGFAARGLDDAAICQIASDDSDGFIATGTVEILAVAHRERQWKRLVAVLVREGRWTEVDGGWLVHDYEQYNMTREYWVAQKEKKQAAGRASGKARAPTHVQSDVGTKAQPGPVEPLRFASLRTTTPTVVTNEGCGQPKAAADFDQVVEAVAQRQLEAAQNVRSPSGWLATARLRIGVEQGDRIRALLNLHYPVEQVVDALEPPPKPKAAENPYAHFEDFTGLAERS